MPRLGNIFIDFAISALQWRLNERDGVSNHRCFDCLLSRFFGRRSKKISKLHATGLSCLCEGNSPVTGEFPTQRASNAENDSIWWRHHGKPTVAIMPTLSLSMTPQDVITITRGATNDNKVSIMTTLVFSDLQLIANLMFPAFSLLMVVVFKACTLKNSIARWM